MPIRPTTRRRLVVGGVVASLVAWGVNTGAPQVTGGVRDGIAELVTPVQERLALQADGPTDRARQERDRAQRELTRRSDDREVSRQLEQLLGAPSTAQHEFVPARVTAFTPATAPDGEHRVTLDVGSRDGIRPQQTVVSSDGLVGRTVTVRTASTDVQVVTSPGAVVGARVQRGGSMGSLTATPPPAVPRRSAGELTLSFVAAGDVRKGDVVRTLGSVGQRPYVRGIVIGRVTGVDPDRGQLGRTARVRPAVDVAELDVVGVIQPEVRLFPRPTLTGTGER